ncbi:dipeptidase [Fictibacillus enclensis]|uniref:dipeptidase n=1 Tax=Fictibacillus enclensis TaxID=1017270 RepID=UPI0025A022C5|nr:dipeptidase [Fictibacillus enclensis]MDM5196722.1 dipeptidase [Fictibacillus enclensis]
MNENLYQHLHNQAIVIDATCPLGSVEDYFKLWIDGGVTVMVPTVAVNHNCQETISLIAKWLKKIENNANELLHITSIHDIYRAKKEHKLGILFHFQNSLPLETDLDLLSIYHRLGVRIIQLCYNVKNFVGDGCDERTDSGLSEFGLNAIREMNRLGILVDLTHSGYQTTIDAIQASEKPLIFSHSNVFNICPSPRNLRDDQIKAIAEKDGVIGVVAYPAFVSTKKQPTTDDLIDHIDYLKKLVGVRHIGIGMDFWEGMDGIAKIEDAKKLYDVLLRNGQWKATSYPPPPWRYPEGVEDPSKFANLTKALLNRGYSEDEVLLILGKNFIRVYKEVWKS